MLGLGSVDIPYTGVNQISISMLLLAEKGSAEPCTYGKQLWKTKRTIDIQMDKEREREL